jgi:hypothetical protein
MRSDSGRGGADREEEEPTGRRRRRRRRETRRRSRARVRRGAGSRGSRGWGRADGARRNALARAGTHMMKGDTSTRSNANGL